MTHPYASAAYAGVFEAAATPLWVPLWRTHVLTRPTPGAEARDAAGCYPLAVLGEDADLTGGLDWLRALGLTAVGLVPDPLTAPPLAALEAAFPLCVPFKAHLLVDYGRPVRFSKHHRYEVKRSLGQVSVEEVALADHLAAWARLYGHLAQRHGIGEDAAFTPDTFGRLAKVEGLRSLAAWGAGEVVSMHLWIVDAAQGLGYSLLAASSPEGYGRSAAYAVYDAAIRLFSDLRLLNLGAGAGLSSAADDGLTRFKRGFANAEVQAVFCGAILDEDRYAALSGGARQATTPFPAYRFKT